MTAAYLEVMRKRAIHWRREYQRLRRAGVRDGLVRAFYRDSRRRYLCARENMR